MLRRAFRNLLNLDEPPERTALAFAVGTFIAFTPLVGLHMVIAGLLLLVWRVNKVALFTGLFITNPWTFAPAIAASWGIGNLIIGSPQVELPTVTLGALVTSAFWQSLVSQWRQLLPYAVGAMILAIVCSLISYPLMLFAIRAYRRKFPKDIEPKADPLSG
ncbi:MAG: DUF2062 domain-containing protein [Acidobacteriota bacterium]|nr:DUF2062 domain-containing protein [Acidobacteriota bacterium]